ncbi:MAG: sirohydrochlorin cobaltochelatase, partial [Clostridia bacterium]|nr:sirohydrochlorin cobaltochelatase [Clostridia bacterium]
MKKYAIIAASFGTVYKDTCENTIGNIENALKSAFPSVPVFRAFTSRMIVDIVKKKGSFEIDLLSDVIKRLKNDGFTDI